jgi:hypothetical protein
MARAKANSNQTGETLSGYFRRVFKKRPKLLHATSVQIVMDRYYADHPNDTEDPRRVKQVLYNVKSVLRSQERRHRANNIAALSPGTDVTAMRPSAVSTANELEMLEEQIDECLALAKGLDRAMLDNVIQHLRRARNAVVLKQGQ